MKTVPVIVIGGLVGYALGKLLGEWTNTALFGAFVAYLVLSLAWAYSKQAASDIAELRNKWKAKQLAQQLAASGIIEQQLTTSVEMALKHNQWDFKSHLWTEAIDRIQRRRKNGHATGEEEQALRARVMSVVEEWKAGGLGGK